MDDGVPEVPRSAVTSAWREVGAYSAADLAREAERLMVQQSPLFSFVLDATADLSDDAHQLALYMGLVLYRTYERAFPAGLAWADAHEVVGALERNQSWIGEVANAHDRILHERILPNLRLRQPWVMEYVGDCIFDSEEELDLDEEDQGRLFLVMQTFADVLDLCAARAGKSPAEPKRSGRSCRNSSGAVYQLKVTLEGIRPPIWRRVQVAADTRMSELHRVLQAAMGWRDEHVHLFFAGNLKIGEAHPEWESCGERITDDRTVELRTVAPGEKSRFTYRYDLGDGWEHSVVVEKVLPPGSTADLPRCLGGRRACPPEDSGGIEGYRRLLRVLDDPGDPEHDDLKQWVGGAWDPGSFELERANERLRGLK